MCARSEHAQLNRVYMTIISLEALKIIYVMYYVCIQGDSLSILIPVFYSVN